MMNKIEVNLSQEKISFVNDSYQQVLQYWKKFYLRHSESKERTFF